MKIIILTLLIGFLYSQDCMFIESPDTSVYLGKNMVRVLPKPTGFKAIVKNHKVTLKWNNYWENNYQCYIDHFGHEPVPADFSLYRYNFKTGEGGALGHSGWEKNKYIDTVPYGTWKYQLMATTDRTAPYMQWSKRVLIIVEVIKPVTVLGIDDEYWEAVKDYEEQRKIGWIGCQK